MIDSRLVQRIHIEGLLSFGPDGEPIDLTGLNVLIGPNGVGKSNLIDILGLLHALPTDLPAAIRSGGGIREWLWKGESNVDWARVTTTLAAAGDLSPLTHQISVADAGGRVQVRHEMLEDAESPDPGQSDADFHYRLESESPRVKIWIVDRDDSEDGRSSVGERRLRTTTADPAQSILQQKREADLYPELTSVARRLDAIRIFRDSRFGPTSTLRQAQPSDLPVDRLLPNLQNIGLVLNSLEHTPRWARLQETMQRCLPRCGRISTRSVPGGSVQIHLHEDGLDAPIPATRLSDGTLRFLALLAILFDAESASLIALEEPELGLHPDALSIVADLLVEASTRTQLVVTTHSDLLISELTDHADSVLVCDYLRNGTTIERRDADHLAFWLDRYRLGEIWRIGEIGGKLW